MPTNRQMAISKGEKFYVPETPCHACGTTAPRKVANGECSQCVENRDPSKGFPPKGQIISRKEAMSKGYKYYFTGKSCPNGHIGYRYVSSCSCSEC